MFNLGGSKSNTKSVATSDAYGYQGANSVSNQMAQSSGLSMGQATSNQSLAFQDLFASLYGQAGGAAANAAQMVPGLQSQAQSLFSGGMGFLDQLGGGAGQQYLQDRLTGPGLADEQIGLLGDDLGRFLREQINPAITSQGVATGTLGGGRQGVAQGLAAERVAGEFQRGAVDIRQREQMQRDQIAAQSAQIGQAGAGAGLAALPGMYGLAEAGATAELAPWAALSSIMGGPQALTQSQSTQMSQDQALSIAEAISQSFGEDWAKSSSTAKGGSKGFNFGIG